MKTTTRTLSTLLLSLLLGAFAAGCDLEDGPIADTSSAVAGRPYFEVWKSTNSRHYFHFVAGNHEIVLASQSYSSRTAALGGVLSVLDNAGLSTRYDLREAANGEYYFNLKAANGHVIGTSELYSTKGNARQGIDAVIANVTTYLEFQATRSGARFEVKEGRDGRFYFNLHAANGAIVLSSQGYSSEAAAFNGTFSVADNGIDAANYDLRESASGGVYFNLIATNGQVVGTSEVYSSKWNAERARDAIIDLLPQVELL